MVRLRCVVELISCDFPHARGDGPYRAEKGGRLRGFSPRPWGWSLNWGGILATGCIFPTPVGMVRNGETAGRLNSHFPHARGDGPRLG